MKPQSKKKVLISFIWIAALADIITFFISGLYEFEINPLYILTKSSISIIGFKLVVLLGLSYLIWKYKPGSNTVAYLYCFLAIYIIFAQLMGAYSNLHTKHEFDTSEPGTVVPMEKEEAIKQYTIFNVIYLYLPMLLSVIAFKTWEGIYLVDLR